MIYFWTAVAGVGYLGVGFLTLAAYAKIWPTLSLQIPYPILFGWPVFAAGATFLWACHTLQSAAWRLGPRMPIFRTARKP